MGKAVLMSIHNLCLEQKYEKYQILGGGGGGGLFENFHCLMVKFSIYLHRRVLVM